MSESDKTNEDVKDTVEEKAITDDTADTVEEAKKTKVKKRSIKKKTASEQASEQTAKDDQREVLTKKLEEMGVMSGGRDVPQDSEAKEKRLSRMVKIGSLAAAVMIGGIVYTELTKDSDSGSNQVATNPVMQNPAMMPPGMYMDPRISPYAQTPVQPADKQPTDEEKEQQVAQDESSTTQAYVDPWGRPYPQRPRRSYQTQQDYDSGGRFEGRFGGEAMSARRWGPRHYPMTMPPQWRQPHTQQPAQTPDTSDQPKGQGDAADPGMPENAYWPPAYPQQYQPFPPPGYYTPYYGYWYPPAY